jgi:hypothetical protein
VEGNGQCWVLGVDGLRDRVWFGAWILKLDSEI